MKKVKIHFRSGMFFKNDLFPIISQVQEKMNKIYRKSIVQISSRYIQIAKSSPSWIVSSLDIEPQSLYGKTQIWQEIGFCIQFFGEFIRVAKSLKVILIWLP